MPLHSAVHFARRCWPTAGAFRLGPPLSKDSKSISLRGLCQRALAAAVLALAVTGCVNTTDGINDREAPATVTHNPGAPTGLAVIGTRTEDGTPQSFGLFGANYRPIHFFWVEFDPETGQYASRAFKDRTRDTTFKFTRGWCFDRPACKDEDYTQAEHILVKLHPGLYILSTINIDNHYLSVLPSESSLLYNNNPVALYEAGLIPGFEIKAGEIVYIGDIILNATGEFPELLRIDSNPEQARAVLPLYPNVSGEMVVRVSELKR